MKTFNAIYLYGNEVGRSGLQKEVRSLTDDILVSDIRELAKSKTIFIRYYDALGDIQFLDLNNLLPSFPNEDNETLIDYLEVRLQNKTLPIVKHNGRINRVYSVDCIHWGFKLKPIKENVHPTIDVPIEDKSDYLLSKEGVNHLHLTKHSLVTIGGLAHRIYGDDEGILIKDGFKTAANQKQIHVNLINFEEVAKLTYRDIQLGNVIEYIEGLSPFDAFYLHYPNCDFSNKTIGISIGGYLSFSNEENSIISRINHNTLRIEMRNFNWFNRIYTILNELSSNNLNMPEGSNVKHLHIPSATSKETFNALINLSQTFLFEIESNGPLKFCNKSLGRMNFPQRYFSDKKEQLPLRLSDGRYPSYFFIDERKGVVVNTISNLKHYYIDNTTDFHKNEFITHYERTTIKPEIQHAKLLYIESLVPYRLED